MSALTGKRILVVEDEALVAMLVEDAIEDSGAILIGPAATVPSALEMLQANAMVHAAVVDVNLDGTNSEPVADLLTERHIPFVFATGYGGEGLPPKYKGHPVLTKPYNVEELIRVLEDFLA